MVGRILSPSKDAHVPTPRTHYCHNLEKDVRLRIWGWEYFPDDWVMSNTVQVFTRYFFHEAVIVRERDDLDHCQRDSVSDFEDRQRGHSQEK